MIVCHLRTKDKARPSELSWAGSCFGAGVSMAPVLGKSRPFAAPVGSPVWRSKRQSWGCVSHCWSGLCCNTCSTGSVHFKLTLGHSEKE